MMDTVRQKPRFTWGRCASTIVAAALLGGCKPPPAAQPPAATGASSTTAAPATTAATSAAQATTTEMVDGLPAKVIENYEQLIKLTADYNARAEKITDRQAYLEQSGALAEIENELSFYVEYMEATEPTLSAAQRATLDSKYYTKAKPLIDAKRQHKMRLVDLAQ